MSQNADALVVSRTPSGLRLFALVPLVNALGAGLMGLLPFFGVPVHIRVGGLEHEAAVRVAAFFCGSVALAFGTISLFMFSVWDTVIDRQRRIIVRRWRLLWWEREHSWPLDGVTHVVLRTEGYKVHHAVLLCGERVEIPVVRLRRQSDGSSEANARCDAHRVAAFLGLDLHDRIRDRIHQY